MTCYYLKEISMTTKKNRTEIEKVWIFGLAHDWDRILRQAEETEGSPYRPPTKTWIVETDSPSAFLDALPAEVVEQYTRQARGLPRNVWLGTRNLKALDDLRALRPAPRVIFCRGVVREEHLQPWRCPRCGRRGESRDELRRQELCPSKYLCGEQIVRAQLQWIMTDEFDRSVHALCLEFGSRYANAGMEPKYTAEELMVWR